MADKEWLKADGTTLGADDGIGIAAIMLHSLTRTSNEYALPDVLGVFGAVARLAGGSIETHQGYAGWRPKLK